MFHWGCCMHSYHSVRWTETYRLIWAWHWHFSLAWIYPEEWIVRRCMSWPESFQRALHFQTVAFPATRCMNTALCLHMALVIQMYALEAFFKNRIKSALTWFDPHRKSNCHGQLISRHLSTYTCGEHSIPFIAVQIRAFFLAILCT